MADPTEEELDNQRIALTVIALGRQLAAHLDAAFTQLEPEATIRAAAGLYVAAVAIISSRKPGVTVEETKETMMIFLETILSEVENSNRRIKKEMN